MKNSKVVLKIYRKSTIKKIKDKIIKAGLDDKLNAYDFLNFRIISSLAMFLILLFMFKYGYIVAPIVTVIYFMFYEYLFLDIKINKRKKKLEYEAIYYFEVLTLTIESGGSLKNALITTNNCVKGELASEFKKALSQIELGKSFEEALTDMKKRIPSDTINNVILNIKESSVFGNSIVDSLYKQIDYLREQHIYEVKAIISKLPVKVSIISVFLFLPIILLLILAPIVIEYLLG